MRKVLPPILHKDAYIAAVERPLLAYFREAIFGPLLTIVEDAGIPTNPADQKIKNAADVLTQAVRSGRLYYTDGVFTGTFNAQISRELRKLGAKWDDGQKLFRLPIAEVPMELRTLLAQSAQAARSVNQRILDTLRSMEEGIAIAPTGIKLAQAVDSIAADLGKQFERTVSGLESVTVQPKITADMRAALTKDLTENIDLSIKNFAAEQIPELRRMVEKNVMEGCRADRLSKLIEARYGVAGRKAKFLASQETSLLVSKYREQKYRALGSRCYRWNTSHDEAVRPDHRILNGKIFDWDSPPITNRSTGARNNPGEDFGCRCLALPVIETDIASILP